MPIADVACMALEFGLHFYPQFTAENGAYSDDIFFVAA